MEIKKLFGLATSFQRADALTQQTFDDAATVARANKASALSTGDDVVSLSNMSRDLLFVSDIMHEDQARVDARIENIKDRISNGTYKVSSEDIAKSLISFASDLPNASTDI